MRRLIPAVLMWLLAACGDDDSGEYPFIRGGRAVRIDASTFAVLLDVYDDQGDIFNGLCRLTVNGHHDFPADHELVPATREGALEPERPEPLDEFPAGDGTPRGHQLACLARTTAFPSGGNAQAPRHPDQDPLLESQVIARSHICRVRANS
jgi:hypothetical protein